MKRLFMACALVPIVAGCASAPVTPVGYSLAIKTPAPASASAGSPVAVVFTVVELESDGSTQPASGANVTVSVTGGGGTVNGAQSATITSSSDGTDSLTWVLGSGVGPQTLRASLSSAEFRDVVVVSKPLPTLLIINGSCGLGPCDSLYVLAYPHNQPRTPGGLWSLLLPSMHGATACITLPPSATFTIYAAGNDGIAQTHVLTWTPAIPMSFGSVSNPAERIFSNPSTAEVIPESAAGWRITLPGSQVVADTACTP